MDDSEDFEDDDFLQEIIEKSGAVNREINETVVRHSRPVQRTLTGEKLAHEDGRPSRYEEITREVIYMPTHHEMNQCALDRYIYPSNFEVRDYQYDIIHKALFKNLLCAIPTGMGKTFIASTVMLNFYRWFKKGKIIFMAPTRPLVAQQIQACLGVTDISSDETAILLDKKRNNRPEIWNTKRVFFTTPQVVENDLKGGILDPKEIVCLVIDEAHRARGNYAYTNVVQFIDRFNTSFRVLALTATPAADIEGVQEVVKNLHISTIEIRTEESFDIVKYMKRKETIRVNCDMNSEMYDIVDLLCEAILPVLKKANEANIYEITEPSRINAFLAMQKSQAIVKNPSIPEGTKWNYFFILQLINYCGQMLRRLKIYGVRTFYSYFENKRKEFKTKWELGKSTNKIAQSFYYHQALKRINDICKDLTKDKNYISHPKIEHMIQELTDFFEEKKESRVIVFTELRESALEIVKCLDQQLGDKCNPHIFIGQARGKEGFNEDDYKMKHGKKGRGKQKRLERVEKQKELEEERQNQKEQFAAERLNSRTGTSEEAQIQGMNQKTQKELIKKFKKGDINVLVATSIGEEGLDIGEVDLIICYDSTSSPIKNIQRMGRTGRKRDGKVILLLSGSEEKKFDQSMEEYTAVQKQITANALDMEKSDRILPQAINPKCVKALIEIPEDNLIIARGEDEDEVIKYATQAMLGKKLPKSKAKRKTTTSKTFEPPPPKITKRFFMPMNAQTGFVNSSSLVRKVGGTSSANSSKSEILNHPSLTDDGDTSGQVPDTSLNLANLFSTPNKSSGPSSTTDVLIKPLFEAPSSTNKATPSTMKVSKQIDEDDIDEIQILDQDYSSTPKLNIVNSVSNINMIKTTTREKRESRDTDIRPTVKKRKIHTSSSKEVSIIENTFDDDSDNDIIINESSDADSLDLILVDQQMEYKVKSKNYQAEVTLIDSDSDADCLDDSLNTVLKDHSLDSRSELKAAPLHLKILNFEAFEDDSDKNDQELASYKKPLKEAKRVMEKQYEEDDISHPSESFQSTMIDRLDEVPVPKKVKTKPDTQISKLQEKHVNNPDITNLLKKNHKKKMLSNLKKTAVDLASSITPSQLIDLDQESQEPFPQLKKHNAKIYLSQKDTLYPNRLGGNEGMLTEKEYNDFFLVYYTPDITSITPNPSITAKRDVFGKLGSSSVTKRFKHFTRLCGAKGAKRLNKLVSELEDARLQNLPVGVSKIIDGPTKIIEEPIKTENKADSSQSSVNFSSDDDLDFINL